LITIVLKLENLGSAVVYI